MVLIGIDDTDNLESRGTGNLAREIASELNRFSDVLGITRHQLLVDPRIPYTKNNSSAAIFVETDEEPKQLFEYVLSIMSTSVQPGSDAGLCLAVTVPQDVTSFGYRAKLELVTQGEARSLAAANNIQLQGISGDEGGIIGALSAVGLAASGEDGRYIQLGNIRDLSGLQPIQSILDAGVEAVLNRQGDPVKEGMVWIEKLRPALRGGKAVAFVEKHNSHWALVRLD